VERTFVTFVWGKVRIAIVEKEMISLKILEGMMSMQDNF
jgi:hypothetical protein